MRAACFGKPVLCLFDCSIPIRRFATAFSRPAIVASRTPSTPHVLIHFFAWLAGDLGYSEPMIAALVIHKGPTIPSRYVHSADSASSP
jgi:hypothetical protein